MDGKAKYIFPALLSGMMAIMMTCVITWLNLGFVPDFVARWLKAFVVAWPLAYLAALVSAPVARKGTAIIIAKLEGRRG